MKGYRRCFKKVSVTHKPCRFKLIPSPTSAHFMCENRDFTHFMSLKEYVEKKK